MEEAKRLREEISREYQRLGRLLLRRAGLERGGEAPPGVRPLPPAREPVSPARVIYQGEPGAYSEAACLDFFGPECAPRGLPGFESVFLALAHGEADYAVVPIENSSTGAIRQVYDLLGKYNFYLVGETAVRVEHCLMAPKGASLESIQRVYSHEQGLFQSENLLRRHPGWLRIPYGDTAGSARYVAQLGDRSCAAICSRRAGALYGLELLAEGVSDSAYNSTRFVVVSPRFELREGADKISAVFALPHAVGSLNEALTVFAVHSLNLVRLESRPAPERPWEYLFFVEFDGNLRTPGMREALEELSLFCPRLRILGNFRSKL